MPLMTATGFGVHRQVESNHIFLNKNLHFFNSRNLPASVFVHKVSGCDWFIFATIIAEPHIFIDILSGFDREVLKFCTLCQQKPDNYFNTCHTSRGGIMRPTD